MKNLLYSVVIMLLMLWSNSYAKAVRGYIITNNYDTIPGVVKVPPMNLITGGLILNSLNFDALHLKVRFKADNQHKTIVYLPHNLLEVGVIHNYKSFIYRSFCVKFNSIISSDKAYIRKLLRLEYNGNYDLYTENMHLKEEWRESYERSDQLIRRYYVAPPTQIFGEEIICGNPRFTTVKDYLLFLKLDDRFVKALSAKNNFKQLAPILQQYDQWLLFKHPLVSQPDL